MIDDTTTAHTPHHWEQGDRVLHPAKPDWGVGTVTAVKPDPRGPKGQMVTARFDRGGIRTISTSIVALRAAGTDPVPLGLPDDEEEAAVLKAIVDSRRERLTKLPETITDSLRPMPERLRAAVALGSIPADQKGLLDWAAAATELPDPLAHFTRHELESSRPTFDRLLTAEARTLIRSLTTTAPDDLRSLATTLSPDQLEWLRRLVSPPTARRGGSPNRASPAR